MEYVAEKMKKKAIGILILLVTISSIPAVLAERAMPAEGDAAQDPAPDGNWSAGCLLGPSHPDSCTTGSHSESGYSGATLGFNGSPGLPFVGKVRAELQWNRAGPQVYFFECTFVGVSNALLLCDTGGLYPFGGYSYKHVCFTTGNAVGNVGCTIEYNGAF